MDVSLHCCNELVGNELNAHLNSNQQQVDRCVVIIHCKLKITQWYIRSVVFKLRKLRCNICSSGFVFLALGKKVFFVVFYQSLFCVIMFIETGKKEKKTDAHIKLLFQEATNSCSFASTEIRNGLNVFGSICCTVPLKRIRRTYRQCNRLCSYPILQDTSFGRNAGS